MNLADWDWLIRLVVGGVVGAFGTGFYDRVLRGRSKSIEDLLKDIKEERRLSIYAQRRVQDEAQNALADWKRQDKLAPPTGKKLKAWPEKYDLFFVREYFRVGKDSACPSGEANDQQSALFIYLDQDENLVARLKEEFKELASKSKNSSDLIRYRTSPKGEEAKVWVLTPNIIIRHKEEALHLFQELAKEVRSWIPSARVVVEAYLPEDIKSLGSIALIRNSYPQDSIESTELNIAARYAIARNKADKLLSQGIILGKLRSPDKYKIPEELLRKRLDNQLDNIIEKPGEWSTITITGPPGSGKTELADLLANELKSKHKMVVLIASTPSLLKQLENLPTYFHREEAFRELVNTIGLPHSGERLVPSQFQGDAEEREGFKDALYNMLRNRRYPVAIFVDDLHAFNKLGSALSKLCQDAKNWGLHFVLIGRTIELKIEETSEVSLPIKMTCPLWDIAQAKLILKKWGEDSKPEQEIEDALERDWPEKKKDFSSYLLRILIKYLTTSNKSPSSLYQEEIKNVLSFVGEGIGAYRQSETEQLNNVLRMLRQGKPADEIIAVLDNENHETKIDPILLFGTLSWASRFAIRDFITVETIRDWAKAYIPDERSARELLNAGLKAQIFYGDEDLASWYDPLVADGCAALYLAHEVGHLEHSSIASMVECLKEAESIDILRLALDRKVLRDIILAVTNARPDLLDAVNRLLSEEFVARLAERPNYVEELGRSLFNQGRKVSAINIEPLAQALHKLLPLSQQLDELCWNAIARSTDDAILALAVKALEWKDSRQFFVEVEKHNSADYLSRVAADMAARLWSKEGAESLCDRLIELADSDFEENELKRLWSLWCKHQESSSLISIIGDLIGKAEVDVIHENVYGLLIATCLKEIVDSRPPSERKKFGRQIGGLKYEVSRLSRQGRTIVASHLIKWVLYTYYPDIIDKNIDWIIGPNRQYALPKYPYSPAFVNEIFPKINSTKEPGERLLFQLPSSEELAVAVQEETSELVRDKLGENFSYNEKVSLGWLVAVSKNRSVPVSKEQLDSYKFHWRPLLKLES